MPLIGLGTFLAKGDEVQTAIQAALKCGIRHIDTAAVYKNEQDVAEALRKSTIPREEVFITTKISPKSQGRVRAAEACRNLLRNLDTDYIDLVLIHWPGSAKLDSTSDQNVVLRQETWEVLEEYYHKGVFRAIGVSNYEPCHLEPMMIRSKSSPKAIPPLVNQIEVHPRWPNRAVREYNSHNGIVTVAYSSLACGNLLNDPTVLEIAHREGVAPAVLLLRWGLQKQCLILPKSVNPSRISTCFAPDRVMKEPALGEGTEKEQTARQDTEEEAAMEVESRGQKEAEKGKGDVEGEGSTEEDEKEGRKKDGKGRKRPVYGRPKEKVCCWPAMPRLISEAAEKALDNLGEKEPEKFCWDPRIVV
eukprot:CAMPEP_0175056338 /NCGR_PEP_ID=MMETSP0052_2-20121109/10612_1 /TAXON_ID=51329 ORGANISM="Polytomella parva, Strain SAG 63-3" /NCGR_SAMPLE_ID=MMETSP0052_2 /ASSEMBLY_ACC=CAM_ASM_000194 /LENGTH=360 /DNA_ID=CAMNT_0016321347 /DNA_START=133 /DNA_END=1215 /DNA_ORIENTATION=-